MQSSKLLEDLAAVNTMNPDKLQDFLLATQVQPSANLPECIHIGSHYGVQYFVKSSDVEIPQDLPSGGRPSAEENGFAGIRPTDDDSSSVGTPSSGEAELYSGMLAFTARSIPSGNPKDIELSYGFSIGRLYHKMPDSLPPQDTGFFVVCNAFDKSIWVAFDFEPYGKTGDIEPVRPEYGDPYGQLPGDKEVVIGIQKLFSGDWTAKKPFSLDHGDPFKNGTGEPLAAKLFATPAFISDVFTMAGGRWIVPP